VIKEITGQSPLFIRPPYFAMTKERKQKIEQLTGMKVLEHEGDPLVRWIGFILCLGK
jgi:hypothetical protein